MGRKLSTSRITPRPGLVPKPVRFWRGRSWWETLWRWRKTIVLLVLVALATVIGDPNSGYTPGFMLTDKTRVDAHFERCGGGIRRDCVVDGDTFRVGSEKIRVVGIDTAEKNARCPHEARMATYATTSLLEWVNRGPFDLQTRRDDPTDRYGRSLRIVTREGADGEVEALADFMIEHGGARGYFGGFRGGWC